MKLAGYEKLENNIDKLVLNSADLGFNITKYLLPDKEAVKRMIAQRNPKMSKEDIDLLVDSEEESLKKDDELEEELKKEDDVEVEDASFDFREDVIIGLPDIPDQTLTESEKELRERQREERREQRRKQREEKKKERERDREIRRENRRKRIRQIKENFKEQLKEIWKEMKEMKTKVIQAAADLYRGAKELIRDLGLAIAESATSIPAIVVIFATPPWNVAQAITLVIEVLFSYLNLITKIQTLAPYLLPLKLLPLLTDRKNLTIVSAILNPILELVLKLWAPITAIKKSIDALIKKLKELMGSNSKDKIFRKATRKLRKFGHIRKFNGNIGFSIPDVGIPGPISNLLKGRGDSRDTLATDGSRIFSFDEDDVDEIQALLDQFVLDKDADTVGCKVVDFRVKFDQQLSELEKEIQGVDIPVEVSEDEVENFIYDVTLPDGTVIKNISEEGIEYFKQNYTVKFTNFTLP